MRRYIEIQLVKCRVFLTQEEINKLLQLDPELLAEAIRRGKAILRARAQEKRREKNAKDQNQLYRTEYFEPQEKL